VIAGFPTIYGSTMVRSTPGQAIVAEGEAPPVCGASVASRSQLLNSRLEDQNRSLEHFSCSAPCCNFSKASAAVNWSIHITAPKRLDDHKYNRLAAARAHRFAERPVVAAAGPLAFRLSSTRTSAALIFRTLAASPRFALLHAVSRATRWPRHCYSGLFNSERNKIGPRSHSGLSLRDQ